MALISGTVAAGFLVMIFKALLPALTRLLTRLAVAKLPIGLRERYNEEWLSYLDEVSGQPAKALTAAGFLAAALRVSIREDYFSTKKRIAESLIRFDIALKFVQFVVTEVPAVASVFRTDEPELAENVRLLNAAVETLKRGMPHFRNSRDRIELMAKMEPSTYVVLCLFFKKRLDDIFVQDDLISQITGSAKEIVHLVERINRKSQPNLNRDLGR